MARKFGQFGIRSIQRGTISVAAGASSNTATVTSVNTAKSELKFLGQSPDAATAMYGKELLRIELTNATTVTATRGGSPSRGNVVSYELVEYY